MCSSVNSASETDEKTPNSNEQKPGPTKITAASLKGPTSIGMVKIHSEKPSLGDNTDVSYEIIATPDIMISRLLSGDIDIATLPTNVAAKLYNKGLDYTLAAVVGYGVLSLVSSDENIKEWGDFKNKKVNITSKGSTPDVIFRYLLENNSIDSIKDIKLDYAVEQVELAQLLIARKAETAVLPEPFTTLVLSKNNSIHIIFDLEKEYKKINDNMALPMSSLLISNELLEKNPEAVKEFLLKYKESVEWVNSNIEEAAKIVENLEIGMDYDTAVSSIPRCNIKFTESEQAKEIINKYLTTLLEFSPEDIGGKIPDENFYY